MRSASILAFLIAAFIFSGTVYGSDQLASLAEKAVAGSGPESAEAVRRLRERGPDGLEAILSKYSAEIARFRTTGTEAGDWKRISAAIDAVAMQKDAYASGLYWYTDLNLAKKAADYQNKPILTLRLLGNLDEEFSCANSRLFRSLLYPNAEISEYLRENYILHWKSVRPAPRITIDFGDGRKIERTVTGNSIHYVIDDDGRIIDGLPGLYGPTAFLDYLTRSKQVNDTLEGKQRDVALMRYRKQSYDRIRARRDAAVSQARVSVGEGTRVPVELVSVPGTGPVTAIAAAPTAVTKMIVTDELSLLRIFDPFFFDQGTVDFGEWQKLADVYSPSPSIDAASIAFIRRQTRSTRLTDAEFEKMMARLRGFIGLDTTRNEFVYHTQLYSWLNSRQITDLEAFNSLFYEKIFLTPDSDEWLGLYSTDVYTALDGNGIIR